MKKRFLPAKVILVAAMTVCTLQPVHAGMAFFDGTNLRQNIVSALESVSQTAKQVEQYQTQLLQYENQLRNSMAPNASVWGKALETIDDVNRATNTLKYYQEQLGDLDAYLNKFRDVNYYRGSPCFFAEGCSEEEMENIRENRHLASEAQKRTNDAIFKGFKKTAREPKK